MWTSLGVSVNAEYIVTEIPNVGLIDAGLEVGFATEDFLWVDYTYIPIFAYGSFHYPIASMPKLVPYAKLGFGYVIVSYKETGFYAGSGAHYQGSYLSVAAQLGAHYFLTNNIALRASVGTPWYLGCGASFFF